MARALVFHSDGFAALLNKIDVDEFPGIEPALKAFLGVVRETLRRLVATREFSGKLHLQETDEELSLEGDDGEATTTGFGLAIGTPVFGTDGELAEVVGKREFMDLAGLLTAACAIPGALGTKVSADAEGLLQIDDAALSKRVEALVKTVQPMELMQASLTEEQEQVLVDAFASLAPPIDEEVEEDNGEDEDAEGEGEDATVLEPVHPGDLLTLLVAYAALAAPPRTRAPNQVSRAVGAARDGLSAGARRLRAARKVVWQLEDLAVGGFKLAVRLVRKSYRPLLVGLIINRSLATLQASRTPEMRASRGDPAAQVNEHFTRTMGPDWQAQIEQDFLDAAAEVGDGLMTDDYQSEKRTIAAAMLRRLEIEDWDKERMRHFYYGSYGLGPWYFDMEERLHNPYFIGARAWNGPIEGWVGRSKAYPDSVVPGTGGLDAAAFEVLEAKKGIALGAAKRGAVSSARALRHSDLLEAGALGRVLEGAKQRTAAAAQKN